MFAGMRSAASLSLAILATSRERILLLDFLQDSGVLLIEHALQHTLLVGDKLPQSTVMPLIEIIPIGSVNNWIDGDPFHGYSVPDRRHDLIIDLSEPPSPSGAKVTGFSNKKRASVAVIHFGQ